MRTYNSSSLTNDFSVLMNAPPLAAWVSLLINTILNVPENTNYLPRLDHYQITSDKVIFRFGKIENPIDGFNLLYINKINNIIIRIYWLNPQSLYNNRIELSSSCRYIAYMTGGAYEGPQHVFHNEMMALWVTDIRNNKIAKVDVGDWIAGTYWWDGDTLRFLNHKQEAVPTPQVPPQ
ncbi:hypothetical protein IAD21_00326 [Abditibacteriota bacterium]|nr:hypothetical protein IAD21_00326 [Abditibacteriota bacterium]